MHQVPLSRELYAGQSFTLGIQLNHEIRWAAQRSVHCLLGHIERFTNLGCPLNYENTRHKNIYRFDSILRVRYGRGYRDTGRLHYQLRRSR